MTFEQKLELFTQHYLIGLLWSSEPDDEAETWEIEELADCATDRSEAECKAFLYTFGAFLDTQDQLEQAGHDFALERNGHGVGFRDRGEIYGSDWIANRMVRYAQAVGGVYPYKGDDGALYIDNA